MPATKTIENSNISMTSADSPKLIPRREYCFELRKHLPEEYFKADPKHVLLYLTCMTLYLIGIYSIVSLNVLPLKFLISIVCGITLASLTFFLHDLMHGSMFKSRTIEYLFGILVGIFNFFPPLFWQRVHSFHHARTGDLDDPDRGYILREAPKSPAQKFAYKTRLSQDAFHPFLSLLFMSTGFFWYFLNTITYGLGIKKRSIAKGKYGNVHILFNNKSKLFVIMELAIILAFQSFLFSYVAKGVILDYFLISLIPAGIAHFTTMLYIHTNHFLSPLTGKIDDPLINSLSLKNPPFIDKIFSNFSHHVEHHLFPSMSSTHYPKVRELLLKLYPDRFQLIPMKEAVRLLAKTSRIYQDFTHLVAMDGKKIIECPCSMKQ